MLILIFVLFLSIFYTSLALGKWLSKKYRFISKIGEKIYSIKLKQLETSGIFSPLRNAVKERSMFKAILVIFPMILLKSVTFYFISVVLITPLILIVQGVAMGSLFTFYKNNVGLTKTLSVITFLQLLSHIIAATFGFDMGLKWLHYKEVDYNSVLISNSFFIFYILVTITAFIAAYIETTTIINKNG